MESGNAEDYAEPLSARATNYALVDRMRDLAKWQALVFGAIGSVLVAGSQLSDFRNADGSHTGLAIIAIVIAIVGAAAALVFTMRVLFPVRLVPALLAKDGPRSPAQSLIREQPELLHNFPTLTALDQASKDAAEQRREAQADFDADEEGDEKALNRAKRVQARIDDVIREFLSYVLAEEVRRRMVHAIVAMLFGGFAVAGGIALFASATTKDDDPTTKGEAAPKRASAVTVRLTPNGREELAANLGGHCQPRLLRAIALGGPAGALEMVAVPSKRCLPARFVLTPGVGAIVNEKRLRAVRACRSSGPQLPCVVYPNTLEAMLAGSNP